MTPRKKPQTHYESEFGHLVAKAWTCANQGCKNKIDCNHDRCPKCHRWHPAVATARSYAQKAKAAAEKAAAAGGTASSSRPPAPPADGASAPSAGGHAAAEASTAPWQQQRKGKPKGSALPAASFPLPQQTPRLQQQPQQPALTEVKTSVEPEPPKVVACPTLLPVPDFLKRALGYVPDPMTGDAEMEAPNEPKQPYVTFAPLSQLPANASKPAAVAAVPSPVTPTGAFITASAVAATSTSAAATVPVLAAAPAPMEQPQSKLGPSLAAELGVGQEAEEPLTAEERTKLHAELKAKSDAAEALRSLGNDDPLVAALDEATKAITVRLSKSKPLAQRMDTLQKALERRQLLAVTLDAEYLELQARMTVMTDKRQLLVAEGWELRAEIERVDAMIAVQEAAQPPAPPSLAAVLAQVLQHIATGQPVPQDLLLRAQLSLSPAPAPESAGIAALLAAVAPAVAAATAAGAAAVVAPSAVPAQKATAVKSSPALPGARPSLLPPLQLPPPAKTRSADSSADEAAKRAKGAPPSPPVPTPAVEQSVASSSAAAGGVASQPVPTGPAMALPVLPPAVTEIAPTQVLPPTPPTPEERAAEYPPLVIPGAPLSLQQRAAWPQRQHDLGGNSDNRLRPY